MSEREDAIKLANKVLATPNRDPDDDLSMLSRQFLRALEQLAAPTSERVQALPYAFITRNSNAPEYFVTIKTKTLKDAQQWHDAVLWLAKVGQ